MLQKVDRDGGGSIDFPEFLALMAQSIKEPDPKDTYSGAFKIFDRDHNNTVQSDELCAIMRQLGTDHAEDVIAVLQSYERNGSIDYVSMIDKITAEAD